MSCAIIDAVHATDYDFHILKYRDERESPEVWSHICVQKLAELAKESTTMRRILDPIFSYFDTKKQWSPRHGLALLVLSDMAYPEKSSGILFIPQSLVSEIRVAYITEVPSNIIFYMKFLPRTFA